MARSLGHSPRGHRIIKRLAINSSLMIIPILLATLFVSGCHAQTYKPTESIIVNFFLHIISGNNKQRQEAYRFIEQNWEANFTPMVLEVIYLNRDLAFNVELIKLLEGKTNQDFGYDFNRWYSWLWRQKYNPHPDYADFKAALYRRIDSKFGAYFNKDRPLKIRLDEVRWGGVRQDGIPPLRYPQMIDAKDADYLEDSNIVFGIEVNGDLRAYPKRILAWHEMFVDTVGGEPVTGVYCTLCGTMILYKSTYNDTVHKLGTSGFLYRSNKLMYDQDTQSLWNTIWGKPVIGPLVNENIQLERLSVVTTTWSEWRKRHPSTRVLSLRTGHIRDYSEGAAYREYFATDELMFNVPELDQRLKNKAEILGLILRQHSNKPLAISSQFLLQHPIYYDQINDFRFVVLTDSSGAHRVYETKNIVFTKWDQNVHIVDDQERSWTLYESRLESKNGQTLYRLPSHRAFWFGWYSAYKHTRLVH